VDDYGHLAPIVVLGGLALGAVLLGLFQLVMWIGDRRCWWS
jgi:hypothetical protein